MSEEGTTVPTRARSHDRETGRRPPRPERTRAIDRRNGVLESPPAWERFLRWQRDRDQDARHVLVERHTPLARSLAPRYARSSEPFDYELVEADASIAAAMRHLSQRERAILHLRFAKGLTQTQIAARIGLSQMRVLRTMRRSLDRLRILVGPDPDPGPT
jgi:DNA-directed RNA polymerase specialized sigma subunit